VSGDSMRDRPAGLFVPRQSGPGFGPHGDSGLILLCRDNDKMARVLFASPHSSHRRFAAKEPCESRHARCFGNQHRTGMAGTLRLSFRRPTWEFAHFVCDLVGSTWVQL